MNLKFIGPPAEELPTLDQLLTPQVPADGPLETPVVTFIYDGYVYAAVAGIGARISVLTDTGEKVCMNLKSHTLRSISRHSRVRPVNVTASVEHAETHRYGR